MRTSGQRIDRLKLAAQLARSGARIFKNAGFSETMGLGQVLALAKTARDARRGIKGGAAIIHLHALTDPLRPALVDGDLPRQLRRARGARQSADARAAQRSASVPASASPRSCTTATSTWS